ncbi:hypothetical protein D3C85_1683440 [compost metagenome]
MQIEYQAIDKMQIVMRQRRILDAQQIRLEFIPCSFKRVLQFTQGPGRFRQQQFTA